MSCCLQNKNVYKFYVKFDWLIIWMQLEKLYLKQKQ